MLLARISRCPLLSVHGHMSMNNRTPDVRHDRGTRTAAQVPKYGELH
jgi:hypothetical protein